MDINTAQYWSERYKKAHTPWDMGSASPPLTGYFQSLMDKNQRILIPGAGNAYESQWLWENGFVNSYTLDISKSPLDNLKARNPDILEQNLIHSDFFKHGEKYDLIVEQTFFCALPPELRTEYVSKVYSLLKPGGRLIGVLFDFPLTNQGPPFGGNYDEYLALFAKTLKVHKLERCYNSIKPRLGKEFFIHLIKP